MHEEKIKIEDVKKLYNNMEQIWPQNDLWYNYTYKKINGFLKKWSSKLNFTERTKIINAGSGGNTYGVLGDHTHVDISERHLLGIENAIVASVEEMPLESNLFDSCICVGSVINYCDLNMAIAEINRVMKKGGILFLDFDQSKSFEFVGTSHYNSNIDIIKTFNSGYEDKIWIYSEKYVRAILNNHNFKIIKKKYYHTISTLVYKITKKESFAAKFTFLDNFVRFIPGLRKISCNIILFAQKT